MPKAELALLFFHLRLGQAFYMINVILSYHTCKALPSEFNEIYLCILIWNSLVAVKFPSHLTCTGICEEMSLPGGNRNQQGEHAYSKSDKDQGSQRV